MSLTKPNQDLRRELKSVAFSRKRCTWLTKDCQATDVTAALKLIAKLYEDADRLADEVKL